MVGKILNVADIYCGAGGLSAGFGKAKLSIPSGQTAHFEIVYGLDKDQNAVNTFNDYHARISGKDNIAEAIPVSKVNKQHILKHAGVSKIDVLIAGPNCQGVSAAGLRNPRDKRNEMFRKFLELVKELQPEWFVMENVPGLTHANNRKLLRTIMRELNKIPRYKAEGDVLLATHFGAPQFRYRLFVIGNRIGAPIRFPNPKFQDLKEFITVRSAIGDLRNVETEGDEEEDRGARVNNHFVVDVGEKNISRVASVEPGEDWRDMPVALLPERFFATRASDQKGTYGRLEWDWPAYTITASVSNVTAGPFTHPEHNRPLSVREAARLQSFDDDHVFQGPIDSQYRQVGNAVPPLLSQAVAEAILFCHFNRGDAQDWGHVGRITLEMLEAESKGKVVFPTLTPRFPGRTPRWERKPVTRNSTAKKKDGLHEANERFVWDEKKRPPPKFPKQMAELKRLAEQPGNYRAAKRARAILAYFDGETQKGIIVHARVSKASVEKWVAGFQESGLEGWRAYHTPADKAFSKGIKKIRETSPEYQLAQNGNKRLHMNEYLRALIQKDRLGRLSVRELIAKVEKKLGQGVGTQYVGDLLAICDVVLSRKRKAKKSKRATKVLR